MSLNESAGLIVMYDYSNKPQYNQYTYTPEGSKSNNSGIASSGTAASSGTSATETTSGTSATSGTSGTNTDQTNAQNQAQYENQNATQTVAFGGFDIDSSVQFNPQGTKNETMTLLSLGDDEPDDPANNLVYQAGQEIVDDLNDGNTHIMENAHKSSQSDAQAMIKLKMAEMDYKMTKELLDGLQKSLDRSSEMLKKNMEEFYKKVKPQIDAMKKQAQEAKALEESGNKEAAAKHLQEVSGMRQELQAQVAALPKTGNPDVDATVRSLIAALNTLQQASSSSQ